MQRRISSDGLGKISADGLDKSFGMGCNMIRNRHKIIPLNFLILFSFFNLILSVGEKIFNFLVKPFITPHSLQCKTALQ
jgi:hypothetical protein